MNESVSLTLNSFFSLSSFQEMIVHPPAPLTAIAATPRKEPDNKFTYNAYTTSRVSTNHLVFMFNETRVVGVAQILVVVVDEKGKKAFF